VLGLEGKLPLIIFAGLGMAGVLLASPLQKAPGEVLCRCEKGSRMACAGAGGKKGDFIVSGKIGTCPRLARQNIGEGSVIEGCFRQPSIRGCGQKNKKKKKKLGGRQRTTN